MTRTTLLGFLVGIAILGQREMAQAQTATVRAPTAQITRTFTPPVKILTALTPKLIVQTPNLYDSGSSGRFGLGTGNFNAGTGELWITAINDGRADFDAANAEVETQGVQNTGTTAWHGVTVTATVQVVRIDGSGSVGICVGYPNSGGAMRRVACRCLPPGHSRLVRAHST